MSMSERESMYEWVSGRVHERFKGSTSVRHSFQASPSPGAQRGYLTSASSKLFPGGTLCLFQRLYLSLCRLEFASLFFALHIVLMEVSF